MLLNKRFQAFVEQRPICVMARGILERVFEPQRLNDLFARHAQAGYTKKLHFATLVQLMADVVLGVKPSVNAAFQALEQRPDGVSKTAVYNKLDRVETVVSEALVRDAAAQCAPAIEALGPCYPPWLPGFRCRVLDGNHLSATEHRLDPLRTIWDAPLPGKALVVLDQERLLAEHAFLTEDGHAQERSLLDAVLLCVQPNDLWIADRNFCTLKFLFSIAQRLGFFVIRQHGTVKGILLGSRRKIGHGHTGVVYEQTIGLTNPETGTVQKWRRITVQLQQPTRDGNTELHLLTNVRQRQADACRVAELYQRRWTIETLFHEVTMTLECEIQTLGYPKAALFAFCLALVAYNAVSLLKASLRAVHGTEKGGEQLSGYHVALEVRGTYDGMMVAIPEPHWHIFQTMSVAELVAVLKEVATYARLERYRKQPRGPKKPPPRKQKYNNGGHASTYKLLNKQK